MQKGLYLLLRILYYIGSPNLVLGSTVPFCRLFFERVGWKPKNQSHSNALEAVGALFVQVLVEFVLQELRG